MPKIILKGYYGFGNFGDDLLMMVCSRWIKEIFPDSTLIVSTAARSGCYIPKLTEGLIEEVVPLSPEPTADLFINGGGGTYFDFEKGNLKHHVLNLIINRLGWHNYAMVVRAIRSMKGWPNNQGAARIALGIGVGKFTKNSKKYYYKSSELAGFQLIVTRDQQSYQNLLSKHLQATIFESTDLAFLREYWLPAVNYLKTPEVKKIGFILKQWDESPAYLTAVYQMANQLASKGFLISVFLFEKDHDQPLIEMFAEFDLCIWDPETMEFHKFLNLIYQHQVMVTARAHGAVVAAALGIPSVCIGIEPKLHTFHKMLPNSTIYEECPLSTANLTESINLALKITEASVVEDFERNTGMIRSSMFSVRTWMNKVLCKQAS